MKKDIHPTYYKDAVIKCACGAVFEAGATVPEINVEICSNCHPFFTGKQKLVDTAGRVDKFKARMEATKKMKEEAAKKAKTAKVDQEDKKENSSETEK